MISAERLASYVASLLAHLILQPSLAFAQPDDRETVQETSGHHESDPSIKLRGLVQADGRFFPSGAATNTFLMRRARLDFQATLGKYFGVRVHPEFAGSLALLDAYVRVGFIDAIELQVGKMKIPIGLELLQSPRDLLFPEFGLPTLLVPNRDVGAVLLGRFFDGSVIYAAGVFNGTPDGTSAELDVSDAKDVAGRLFVQPFRRAGIAPAAGLGAGIAASWGKQLGALPAHRTPGRQTFFAYLDSATAAGPRTRLAPQGYYYFGPIGLLGEYVRSTQDVSDGSATTTLTSSAWQVWGSVVLGGKAGYDGVQLSHALDPHAGTWGALELSARYAQLDVEHRALDRGLADPSASAHAARNFGVALSWWFATGTRAHLGFDRTRFEGGAMASNRPTESVLLARLQLAL